MPIAHTNPLDPKYACGARSLEQGRPVGHVMLKGRCMWCGRKLASPLVTKR